MAFSLTDAQNEVLNILQKESSYQGFFTTDKVKRAVNESIAYVTAQMMMEGNGWRQKIAYITTTANTAAYNLPTDCSIIIAVRYLMGDVYYPLRFVSDFDEPQLSATSGLTDYVVKYRIVGNQIYFNPIPQNVGTNYLQLEYTSYPAALSSGTDEFGQEFDTALYYYVIYRSAGILVSQAGNAQPEWQLYELQWFNSMKQIITKRLRVSKVIREFGE